MSGPTQEKVVEWARDAGFGGSNYGKHLMTDSFGSQVCLSDIQHLVAIAYAAGQASKQEWQPIETAPKDGTRIWIYSERRGTREARFYQEFEDGTSWYDVMVGGGPMTIFYDATHWMPLPAARLRNAASNDPDQLIQK